MRIGWIGLGTMGASMAGHLVDAGHDVVVYNRTPGRETDLVTRGAVWAETPAAAAGGADVVITCVSDSPDVQEVVLGPDGATSTMAPGSVLVDCSTIAPATTRRIATILAERGIGAVDAPVSGGSEGAQRGTLTAFVGGEVEPGAGQAAKAVNQVLIAGTYATLAEALLLGEREGLPMEPLVAALSSGAAQSWVLANRSRNVIDDDYPLGFRVALHLKDLRIALEEADALGLPLEITRAIAEQERRLVDSGFGEEDLSNLARIPRGLA
jgi:3-hydroxyisobutyrate dehydrogenase